MLPAANFFDCFFRGMNAVPVQSSKARLGSLPRVSSKFHHLFCPPCLQFHFIKPNKTPSQNGLKVPDLYLDSIMTTSHAASSGVKQCLLSGQSRRIYSPKAILKRHLPVPVATSFRVSDLSESEEYAGDYSMSSGLRRLN